MRMITTVNERGRYIATFRYISVWMMETTARWTPISPRWKRRSCSAGISGNMPRWPTRSASARSNCVCPSNIRSRPLPAYDAVLKDVVKASTTADRIATLL